MDGKGAIVCNCEGRRFMGGQKPEKVKKHICTGLLAHAHDGSTKGRSGHDKKRRRMMECILKILRLYLFRMNCDILLVFAFGFIRECHFKASSIKQRMQIPVGKILCVFITTVF